MSPLDDDAVAALKRTPPTEDLDVAPDLDAPPQLALPADANPSSWGSLDDVLADVARAKPFEEWIQEEGEDG